MLEDKLKRQVMLATWQLILGIGIMIGYILMFTSLDSSKNINVGTGIGLAFIFIFWIAYFVFWIIGIVNATAINGITHDSSILIVFAVLTFWFAHLIVAVSQKNKYLNGDDRTKVEMNNRITNSVFEKKLKQAFVDEIISSSEYEQKLKEYRDR